VVATQRPSVDVITGVIKANFPARMAFKVSSRSDSRTILDTSGAEQLLGCGDMLLKLPFSQEQKRIQGAFISREELTRILNFFKER
jgi:S-DNA-T family DNA segregation ATPase FtsK/SpoIIIE